MTKFGDEQKVRAKILAWECKADGIFLPFSDGEFDPVFLSWREGAQERKRLMVQEKNGMPDGTGSDWIKPTVGFFVCFFFFCVDVFVLAMA